MASKHVIVSIEDDRDRVRKRPTIYIPDTGKAGAVHIIFEVIDNSLDELTANDAVGHRVRVEFDDKTKICKVTDDGGGIPHDGLVKAFSVINSSGKFDNGDDSHFGTSGGINGIGAKLANFLSEWCTVSSTVRGKTMTCRFVDGRLVETTTANQKGHGTTVEFKLDQRFVDVKSVTCADINERYQEKAYLFPDLELSIVVMSDSKVKQTMTYYGKSIMDRVCDWRPDVDPIRITGTGHHAVLADITDDAFTEKKVTVDLVFGYSEAATEADNPMEYIIAYGNTIKNYMGGTHVEGLKQGLIRYFQKNIIPKLKGRDAGLQIMPSDITSGLCAFIVAKVFEPEFRGQYKDQLSNPEVKYVVRDIVYDKLCEMKPAEVSSLIDFVKRTTRGRMASKKARKKNVQNSFSEERPEKYHGIVENLDTLHPEIILVEG